MKDLEKCNKKRRGGGSRQRGNKLNVKINERYDNIIMCEVMSVDFAEELGL